MSVLALVLAGGAALAANPSATGQPNQSCEEQTTRPGDSMSAPGSAFNPDGVAGTHYAGQQPQNSQNPNSVSQYDVACFQVSQNH
ncbi:MAG: hypothetical protein AUH85_07395 [Chloroflexi bacterium 13_1_40CM_4_68_4]|nr:MAG: hypothetical protein AUH85_07395 [Chloroflexi bacterium 13_1_40CM_4_68_4]